MKTLHEVEQLVGMSRRIIQEYEKAGIAEKPTSKNKYGYLLYDEAAIDRLWEIRFYREMEYNKVQMKAIFDDPKYNIIQSLDQQIEMLQKKKNDIDVLIKAAKTIRNDQSAPSRLRSLFPSVEFDLLLPLLHQYCAPNSNKDEYDPLDKQLTKDDFYGFVFCYDNGELSQPETKSKTEVSMFPSGASNDDAIYIFCNKCNRFMCFEDEKEGTDTRRWTCPVCGASVSEEQPYDILEEMNREFEKWLYTDDDY